MSCGLIYIKTVSAILKSARYKLVSSYLFSIVGRVSIEHGIQIVVISCCDWLISIILRLLSDALVACQDLALWDVHLACTHDLSAHEDLALSV